MLDSNQQLFFCLRIARMARMFVFVFVFLSSKLASISLALFSLVPIAFSSPIVARHASCVDWMHTLGIYFESSDAKGLTSRQPDNNE